MENGAKLILTPRPRQFGKTLNLSMLKYFFNIRTKEETIDLFKGLKIENEKEIIKLQGEYPVIFITFKNQKHISFEDFQDGIRVLISNLYREHEYLLNNYKLSEFDKNDFKEIILRKTSILRYSFNDKFGFTEEEVEKLSDYYSAMNDIENIKKWYI